MAEVRYLIPSSEAAKQQLVIVGGGFGGMEFINSLKAARPLFDVTVVDSKDWLETPPMIIGISVLPEKAKEGLIKYSDTTLWPGVKFVHGYVTKVLSSENKIELKDGTQIKYDKLVVAVGSSYPNHPWLATAYQYSIDSSSQPKDSEHKAVWKLVKSVTGLKIGGSLVGRVLANAKLGKAVAFVSTLLSLSKENTVKPKSFKKSLLSVEHLIGKKLTKSVTKQFESYQELAKDSEVKSAKAKEFRDTAKQVVQSVETLFRQTLAEGMLLPDPTFVSTIDQRLAALKLEGDRIRAAKSVAILGGGIVGIEVAAEISAIFPDKTVTIIHSGPKLFDFSPSGRGQRYIKDFTERHKIQTIFNDTVEKVLDHGAHYVVTTKAGATVTADLVISAVGTRPNTKFLRDGDKTISDALSPKGYVKVDKHFLVQGTNNVYCIGDAADSIEPKTALTAYAHGQFLAKTFNEAAEKAKISQWVGYTEMGMSSASLGPWEGLFLMKGTCLFAGGTPAKLRRMFGKKQMLKVGVPADQWTTDWNLFIKALRQSLAVPKPEKASE